jgi:septum formation protein
MLRRLSGRAHEVMTGVAVVATGHVQSAVVTSTVRFRVLDGTEIDAYVSTGEPLDKAGAYAIQGAGRALVDGTSGPFDNIVGLPVDTLAALLDAATSGS